MTGPENDPYDDAEKVLRKAIAMVELLVEEEPRVPEYGLHLAWMLTTSPRAGVRESAVIGLPQADLGETVAAVVIRDEGAVLTEAAILEHLKSRLARYKLPRRVLFLDEMPRNAMGKVLKSALRATCRDCFAR